MDCQLEVVNIKKIVFSGFIKKVKVCGIEGNLCIYPNHAQLLTFIKPGLLSITDIDNKIENLYISGGILEIQPKKISILADSIIRAVDLDRQNILKNKERLERNINFSENIKKQSKIIKKLSKEIAKLKIIEMMEKSNL
ncbi:ATP synthase F1 subunit epsilon [Buchnera aphidicola (Mindarus keteleerifoliae)]|uniref:ATP synthase F1 subunit epsilon n=1 Tax=Buchnera aphidicola TaxID=9 RepID=UPI0031B6B342